MVERVLDLATAACGQAEVYAEEQERTQASFEANRLKLIESRESSGLALRVIANGRVGFSSMVGGEDARQVVDAALEVAPFGAEARFAFPGRARHPRVLVEDSSIAALTIEEMVGTGQSIMGDLLRFNARLVCSVSVDRRTYRVRLINSSGGGTAYRKTVLSVSANANWTRDTPQGADILDVWDSQTWCSREMDVQKLVSSICQRLEMAESTAQVSTAEMPVVFTPAGFAATFMQPLQTALNGKTVLQGASPLGDKLNRRQFDARLSLLDTALIPYAAASAPIDDEGMPSRETPLIKDGFVRNFVYDLQTAGLAGKKSTANGSRSLESLPSPASAALVMSAGETSFEAIIGDIKSGLLVDQVMGSWAGNQLSGDFSGNIHLGYRIESGRVAGRVKDAMVAGNIYQAMRRFGAIGDQREWVHGSMLLPCVCISKLKVSTKG